MSVPIGHANTVVVGVDGSESAREAVRWAAAEAGRRDAVLRIVHAELPLPADALDMTGMARQALHDEAMSWVRTAIRTAGEIAPGVETQARVEVGLAALLLEEESAASALVVVGSRGLGGFTGLVLGSVAVALSCHAKCPVVVVRGDDSAVDGPVVVGINGLRRTGTSWTGPSPRRRRVVLDWWQCTCGSRRWAARRWRSRSASCGRSSTPCARRW